MSEAALKVSLEGTLNRTAPTGVSTPPLAPRSPTSSVLHAWVVPVPGTDRLFFTLPTLSTTTA